MVTLRVFLAILAGFASMLGIVLVTTALMGKLVPRWAAEGSQATLGYVSANLACSFAAAAAGGYITAWIAVLNPLSNVLALAVVVLVVGAIGILQAREKEPVWYQIALLVLSAAGIFLGGVLRLRLWESL